MDKLAILPDFLPGQPNSFTFPHQKLNTIARAEYQDTFGVYQRLFNVFSYMQMNRRNKFVVHYPKGTPLVWQPYKACSYNHTGSMSLDSRELTPDPIYMKEKFCHDVLLDSCFEHLIQYPSSGEITLDATGVQLFNQLIDELLANAQLGFRISAVAGQMYDVDAVEFSESNTAELDALFQRVHNTIKGIIKISYDMARQDKPWLDAALVADTDFDETGTYVGGNPIEVVDALVKSKAQKPLRQLYNRGGVAQTGRFTFLPLIICSDGWYASFLEQYQTESEQTAVNRTRLSKRSIAAETSPTPTEVLYLDGRVPIIPLSEITGFDPYVKGNLNYLGVISSGNMQIGASFSQLPENIEQQDIGVLVGRNENFHDDNYGSYTVLSHALAKTALADPNYAVGTINYTVPA